MVLGGCWVAAFVSLTHALDTFFSSRCQAVEQLRAQAAKEAEALGKELEEVKAGV